MVVIAVGLIVNIGDIIMVNIIVIKKETEMKKIMVAIMLLVTMTVMTTECFAHSGGLDGWGGHYVRTPGWGRVVGTYHFHR